MKVVFSFIIIFLNYSYGCELTGLSPLEEELKILNELISEIDQQSNLTSQNGDKLEFGFSEFSVEGDYITFINPEIDHRPVVFSRLSCRESRENIFGRDVCRQWGHAYNTRELCEELGYDWTKLNTYTPKSNLQVSTFYTRNDDGWSTGRTSFVAFRHNVNIVTELTCKKKDQ